MNLVYVAQNIIEAKIIKDLLDGSNIDNKIMNEHAIGAVGELPFIQTYPEIWLTKEEDFLRAKELIGTFVSSPNHPDTHCSKCGESIPSNFELCWNCGES